MHPENDLPIRRADALRVCHLVTGLYLVMATMNDMAVFLIKACRVRFLGCLVIAVFSCGCSWLSPCGSCPPQVASTLHEAAESGNMDLTLGFLAKGGKIDARDTLGRQPLHGAAESGNVDLVRYLVEHGADVRAKDHLGQMPVHFAAEYGHVAVVEYLLAHGAKVDDEGEWRETPLCNAAGEGRFDVVKLLIGRGAKVRVKTDGGGWMPIHRAATTDSAPTVKYLLAHGAKVGDRDDSGDTPLHLALRYGKIGRAHV